MSTPVPHAIPAADPAMAPVIGVSALNRLARETLEQAFPLMWIAGEVSNMVRAASGHIYFSLKDQGAQVRCAMFRGRAQLLPFALANGMQIEVRALVTLYESRGDFQLNVESVRRAGPGALFEAFVRLKERLAGEGLFDEARKRTPPTFPRRIGIVSSPQAAALADILASLRRRAPHVPVIIYPTSVQGEGAPLQIAQAVRIAGERAECDVLLVARGGGSIEDLWAFNDEALAREIAGSRIPVITGIGHESDFTIADFVSDRRAATPTAAAELASAGWFAATDRLAQFARHLRMRIESALHTRMQRLDLVQRGLLHPARRLRESVNRIALLGARLSRAAERSIERERGRIGHLHLRLRARRPDLASLKAKLEWYRADLWHAWQQAAASRRTALVRAGQAVHHLGPQTTLARGFSIASTRDGRIVRDARDLAPGTALSIRFASGSADATVTRTVVPNSQPE